MNNTYNSHYVSHAGLCVLQRELSALHLFHVILNSLLTGGEELIAVFSLSFSISLALSLPLSLKLMCGVTVNPPRPIHSTIHHIHHNSLCSVCISAPPQLTLSSQSRSTALNLNLAHLQSLPHSPLSISLCIPTLLPIL